MADAAAVRNIFASPNPEIIYETAKACHRGGNGILFLYGNYSGDVMNFDIAAKIVQRAVDKIRSMGTAFEAGTMLNTGKPWKKSFLGHAVWEILI